MKYDIVLGRDMLDLWMLGINYTESMIYFRSEVDREQIATEVEENPGCFLIKDTVLEANSFTQVEFEADKDISEGQIVGNEELAEQGILVTRTNFLKDDKYCWVCNVSKVPVTLEKNAVMIRTATPGWYSDLVLMLRNQFSQTGRWRSQLILSKCQGLPNNFIQ